MCSALRELHPAQDYRLINVKDYGHLDGIIGKYACHELWPDLLSFLDKYSESTYVKNKDILSQVVGTMKKLKMIDSASDLSEKLQNFISLDITGNLKAHLCLEMHHVIPTTSHIHHIISYHFITCRAVYNIQFACQYLIAVGIAIYPLIAFSKSNMFYPRQRSN